MGHIKDFSKYITKNDLFQLDSKKWNRFLLADLDLMNQSILEVLEGHQNREDNYDFLYKLSLRIQQFIQRNMHEIKFQHQLKIQCLNLMLKVKSMNYHNDSLTNRTIQQSAEQIIQLSGASLSLEKIQDLMRYETYAYLNLITGLSVQNKLKIAKVRDVELYSLLLDVYKKPNITAEYLEQYFQKYRSEILLNLVNMEQGINHIHYDLEYLQHYISLDLAYQLLDQDYNEILNAYIQEKIMS